MSLNLFQIKNKKIFVAGHNGMVGSAILRRLANENTEIVYANKESLDLRNQINVDKWLSNNKPDIIIICAAKVGGIHANNTMPVDFLYDNLMIASNLIHGAHKNDIDRLLFLGSSCIYPKYSNQPIKEDELLTSHLESTNQWYAIAKIAGIKLCQAYQKQYKRNYISAMPTNMYGPKDNYDLETSHVLPALLRKCHEAKIKNEEKVVVWGTGKVRREFMYVDDCADAIIFLLKNYSDYSHINIGYGEDLSIIELVNIIKKTVKYDGEIKFDKSKPDGTPRKLLDSSKMNKLGWTPRINLLKGLELVYEDFKKNYS